MATICTIIADETAQLAHIVDIDTALDYIAEQLPSRINGFNQQQIDADTLGNDFDNLMEDAACMSQIPASLEQPIYRALCRFYTHLHLQLLPNGRGNTWLCPTSLLTELNEQRSWAHKEAAKQGGAA
jgi:hypothetical protein